MCPLTRGWWAKCKPQLSDQGRPVILPPKKKANPNIFWQWGQKYMTSLLTNPSTSFRISSLLSLPAASNDTLFSQYGHLAIILSFVFRFLTLIHNVLNHIYTHNAGKFNAKISNHHDPGLSSPRGMGQEMCIFNKEYIYA